LFIQVWLRYGDGVSVGVGVLVEKGVGVLVGVSVGVAVGVPVGVLVGVSVGVAVAVLVGVGATKFRQAASNLNVLFPLLRAITRTITVPAGAVPSRVYCVTRGALWSLSTS